jgi:hypothetical protein
VRVIEKVLTYPPYPKEDKKKIYAELPPYPSEGNRKSFNLSPYPKEDKKKF